MEGFAWAESHLDTESPHLLQDEGVQVYFAPNISPNKKVVDLEDGMIETFMDGETRPKEGYFAEVESVERYCRKKGITMTESNGFLVPHGAGTRTAGDPLRQGG